jgi:hypothetical protein
MMVAFYGCQEAESQNIIGEISSSGFEISIPQPHTYSIDTSSQSKVIKEYVSSLDSAEYTMRITTYKNNMYNSDSISRASFDLNYSQRYFAKNTDYQLIGMILKSEKGFPGKEFRFVNNNEGVINFRRVFIVENNLIELIYAAPTSKLYHTDIDNYFNSFKLPGFEPSDRPFLSMPTDDEIENSPITADFIEKPNIQIEANRVVALVFARV